MAPACLGANTARAIEGVCRRSVASWSRPPACTTFPGIAESLQPLIAATPSSPDATSALGAPRRLASVLLYTASGDDPEATARYLASLDPGHDPYKYLVSITQAAVVLDSRLQRLGLRDSHRPARPNRRRWAAPPRASQSAARLPSAPIPPDTTHADPAPTWKASCPSSPDAHSSIQCVVFFFWM